MIRSYAELLRLPGASAAAVPAALARLAGTMVPLALLLTAVQSGHSIAAGGGAGAAYALGGAVAGPAIGRLMDRLGPAPVLRITGPVAGLVLAAAALAADRLPTAVLLAAAAAAGLATAPVGASVRAMWGGLTEDAAMRQRAYSFEATLSELLFILGPTVVTVLGSLVGARDALLVTAALLGAGAVGYGQAAVVRRRRPQPPSAAPEGPGARRSGPGAATLSVLAAIALTAALSSALAVAVTAALRDQGSAAELAGTLVALQSAGSVVGGLVYGARSPKGSTYRRYVRLLVVLALALAVLPTVHLAHRAGLPASWTLVLLGALLLLSGLPIAPAGAEEFQLIGEMTARRKMTQAFAGVGSFIAVGAAAGSALAGLVADHLGPAAALSLPAVFTALALLVSLAARGPISAALAPEPTASHPPPAPEPSPARPATPDLGEQHP
ncbi:MFS transporter [Kitasatospora sp. NPDC096128]|uniref:MFS transporter n=1 Tax=Kitasatospora sp. NPDC096128 TaxID=3155547 RepID=UPI0033185DF5